MRSSANKTIKSDASSIPSAQLKLIKPVAQAFPLEDNDSDAPDFVFLVSDTISQEQKLSIPLPKHMGSSYPMRLSNLLLL